MSASDDEFEALVAGMRGPFLETAAHRTASIVAESSDLALAVDPVPSLASIIREAHTLRGGAAAFDLPSLGRAAGVVEELAKAVLQQATPLPPLDELHAAVERLRRELAAARA